MDIVVATWGLVLATLLLVVASIAQLITARRQADRTEHGLGEQLKVLAAQSDALAKSAEANARVADEMREGRKAANPLRLTLKLEPSLPAELGGQLVNEGDRAVILKSTTLFRGQGPDERHRLNGYVWGNGYVGVGGQHPVVFGFAEGTGDLLVLEVVGTPTDGLEQTQRFLLRIRGDGTAEDLSAQGWDSLRGESAGSIA